MTPLTEETPDWDRLPLEDLCRPLSARVMPKAGPVPICSTDVARSRTARQRFGCNMLVAKLKRGTLGKGVAQ